MMTNIFSEQQIETIAQRAFDDEQVQVLNYQLKSFSKDKVGFLGTHQNLEMTIKRHDKSGTETCRFFVKSLPSLTDEQLELIREGDLFGQEATYFNDILPLLKKSCPVIDDWCPKCLLASDRVVVLEDMRLRKYAMSETKMLTEEQLIAAFKAQARLHAASRVAEKQLGKTLVDIYPKIGGNVIFNEDTLKRKRLELFTELAEKVAERLGRDNRRLCAGFRKGFFQMLNQNKLSTKLPKVVTHGDAWSNNHLFDTSDPPKCVLVDFQLIGYGPPMYDATILTYIGTTHEFRQKVVRKAIEAYHQQFCEVLEANDAEIKKPTLEDFLEEYEELRITALLCATIYYPIIWVSKSTMEKYGEHERYKNIMFRQDNSFVMQIYDEDKMFADRINDVVQEAVEYFEQQQVPIEQKNGFP